MLALDAQTGELLWSADVGRIQSNNAIARSLVLAGSRLDPVEGSMDIAALDRQTGAIVWQSGEPRGLNVVTDNRQVYAVVSSTNPYDSITAYTLTDGTEVWRHDLDFDLGFFGRIAVTDDRLFVASSVYQGESHALFAVETQTGTLFPKIELPYRPEALAVANGVVYVGMDGKLHAYDAATLDLLWDVPVWAQDLAIDDGYLFVSTVSSIRAYR
jgi:outer membrane protein assembly factor BamB